MDTRTLCAAGSAQGVGQSRFPVSPQTAAPAVIAGNDGPTKVITLRIPMALHRRIANAAHLEKTSMNLLLAAAALQAVEAAEQHDAERIRAAAAQPAAPAALAAA